MSNFLLDKKYSEMYEIYFGKKLGLNYSIDKTIDDKGADLWNDDGHIIIDVKCYSRPVWKKEFDGIFVETYLPLSGNPGWATDEKKWTTEYIFIKDCFREIVKYDVAWRITRNNFIIAMNEASKNKELVRKEIRSAHGYILPYKYLYKYGEVIE